MNDDPATPQPVDLAPDVAALLTLYREADQRIRELTERKTKLAELIQSALGDSTEGRIDGRPVITWAWSKPATRIDADALKRDHPDLYAKYLREKKPARPFKLLDGA
jgi:predicted phage-related endonuclease